MQQLTLFENEINEAKEEFKKFFKDRSFGVIFHPRVLSDYKYANQQARATISRLYREKKLNM